MRAALILTGLVPLLALAQSDRDGTHDHPAVKRWPGSFITDSEVNDSESFKFPVKDRQTRTVEGKSLLNVYRLPPRVTCAQVSKSFAALFKSRLLANHSGVLAPAPDIDWANGKWISGEGNAESGGQLFIVAACPTDNFEGPELFLWVVENQKMQSPFELDAEAMAELISKHGSLAVYEITFAPGKADPKPESGKALEQIAALLKNKPDWKLRIEAHTDNVGAARANLALSKKRADAVKAWLTTKLGVDAARLTADGFGDKQPASPNSSELGRANNRRIQLVKQ